MLVLQHYLSLEFKSLLNLIEALIKDETRDFFLGIIKIAHRNIILHFLFLHSIEGIHCTLQNNEVINKINM